ncbi:MAG: hypothetical protein AAGP08_05455, partial [Pseudomonadota bacterium]
MPTLVLADITGSGRSLAVAGELVAAGDDAFTLVAVRLDVTFGNGSKGDATFRLTRPMGPIDRALLSETSADTFVVATDFNGLPQHVIDAAEAARRRLQQALAEPLEIVADGGAFGATSFTQIRLRISPLVLDPAGLPDDSEVFQLDAQQSVNFSIFGDAAVAAKIHVSAAMTKGDVAALGDGLRALFDIEAPDLPQFHLRLPTFELKGFDISGVDLPFSADGFLPALPKLPLPDFLRFDEELKVTVDPEPKVTLSVSSGNIAIATETAFELKILYETTDLLIVEDMQVAVDGDDLELRGTLSVPPANVTIEIPEIDTGNTLPLRVVVAPSTVALAVTFDVGTGLATITATHDIPRIVLRAHDDPALSLHCALTVIYAATSDAPEDFTTKVDAFSILEPYPIELITAAAEQVGRLIRFIGGIEFGNTGPSSNGRSQVLARIADLLRAAGRWLIAQGAAAGRYLASVAEAVADAIFELMKQISLPEKHTASGFPALSVEVRLNPDKWKLEQIIIAPVGQPTDASFVGALAGFELATKAKFRPAFVLDFSGDPWFGLVLFSEANETPSVTISTDLWLDRTGGPPQPMGTLAAENAAPKSRLIKLTATAKNTTNAHLVLAAIQNGKGRFFQVVAGADDGETVEVEAVSFGGSDTTLTLGKGGGLKPAILGDLVDVTFDVRTDDLKQRALALFPKAKPSSAEGPSFLQKVEITEVQHELDLGIRELQVSFKVSILLTGGFKPTTELVATLDLDTFEASLDGDHISIMSNEARRYTPLDLELTLKRKPDLEGPTFEMLRLDLSQGAERLSLGQDALAELSYRKVSN